MIWGRGALPAGWRSRSFAGYRLIHAEGEGLLDHVREDGSYERESVQIVAEWHGRGAVGLDAGANIGLFALSVLRSGMGDRIFAFEPNPATFARLHCTIHANALSQRLAAFPIGLSNTSGIGTFFVHHQRFCSGDGLKDTGRAGPANTIPVPCHTVDDVVSCLGLERLDWMKLDVEGAESLVLRGAHATIRRFRPRILFEAHPVNLAAYQLDARQLHAQLESQEYRVLSLHGERLTADRFSILVAAEHGNFIGMPATPEQKARDA